MNKEHRSEDERASRQQQQQQQGAASPAGTGTPRQLDFRRLHESRENELRDEMKRPRSLEEKAALPHSFVPSGREYVFFTIRSHCNRKCISFPHTCGINLTDIIFVNRIHHYFCNMTDVVI